MIRAYTRLARNSRPGVERRRAVDIRRLRACIAVPSIIGVLLMPAVGPASLWALVAVGMHHAAIVAVVLAAIALMIEVIALRQRRCFTTQLTLVRALPD
jgi:hypothetical protein